MDANFRLTNRLIKGAHDDPPLGPGWGHLVDDEPYREHLKAYISEKDVRTWLNMSLVLIPLTDNNLYRVHGTHAKGLEGDHRLAHVGCGCMHVRAP